MLFLVLLAIKIFACPPNCDECSDDPNICTACHAGYGFVVSEEADAKTVQCEPCPEHCNSCTNSSKICDDDGCEDGYGLEILPDGTINGTCGSCPENCDPGHCKSNSSYCTKCLPNYGFVKDANNENTGQCKQCPEYCTECSEDSSKCTQCDSDSGLVLDDNKKPTGKCAICPGKCNCSTDASQCQCEQRYGKLLDENGKPTGLCANCPVGCIKCDENSEFCTECGIGYGIIHDENGKSTGMCGECTGLCKSCKEDYTKCTECGEYSGGDLRGINCGKVFDSNGVFTGECNPCQAHCQKCDENYHNCTACYSGYDLKYEKINNEILGICVPCLENCDSDRKIAKASCEKGFLKDGKCIPCHKHCDKCDETRKCIQCEEGFGLSFDENGNSTGKCKKCPKDCLLCNSNHLQCDVCKDGYTQDLDLTRNPTGECHKISINLLKKAANSIDAKVDETTIENCITVSNGRCVECDDGYGYETDSNGKYTGKCKKCPENCEDCQSDPSVCSLCKYGYGFVLDSNGKRTGQCKKCAENCLSCTLDYTKCTYCDSEYGLAVDSNGKSTGECKKCPFECEYCPYDNTKCMKCGYEYGLLIINNKKLGTCERCTEYCEYCYTNNQYCLDCPYSFDRIRLGHELDQFGFYTGKCVRCSENCDECSDSKSCSECLNGYYLVLNNDGSVTCSKCSVANCKDCSEDPNSCESCIDGFIIETNNGVKTCAKCPSNCQKCESATKCTKCIDGYGLKHENGVNTYQCEKCPSNCESCTDSSKCESCDDGYGVNGGKCIKCIIENCRDCNYNTDTCSFCYDKFQFDRETMKCIPCPANCDGCWEDTSFCDDCSNGYGSIYENGEDTGRCGKCADNCYYCQIAGECTICDEGYCYDFNPDSPNYHKCLPCNGQIKCLVDGCLTCQEGTSDKCLVCNSTMELDNNYKCIKKAEEIDKEVFIPVYVDDKDIECTGAHCKVDFDNTRNINQSEQIVYPPEGYTPTNTIEEIEIKNTQKRNIAIQIGSGLSDIVIKISEESDEKIDIKFTDNSPSESSIKLDSKSRASIKDGKGTVTINSAEENKDVTLNQVRPSTKDFKIIPDTKIIINEVNFNSKQALLVQSEDNKKVEIKSLKVEQAADAKIANATINGHVKFGISSFLEIDKSVNLDGSHLDIPYNKDYGQSNNKAPIYGIINSVPSSIVITDRKYGQNLDGEKIIIAQSFEEFNCGAWKDLVKNEASNSKIGKYECENVNNLYRLYAEEKDDDKSGGGLKPAAIAGIVVGVVVVVGLVVFLLVYFLVIKKRSKNNSSEQEENEDKNANDV